MLKYVLNVLMTASAVLLLGMLVLLSTTVDDDVRRRLDHSLRQLRDIGLGIEREALNARNLNVDNGTRLLSMEAELRRSVNGVGQDLSGIYQADGEWLPAVRESAVRLFNSIDSGQRAVSNPDLVLRKVAELDQSAGWLGDRVGAFADAHTEYLAIHERVANESRGLVKRLREGNQTVAADAIFRASQQVLDRAQRGGATELEQIAPIVDRVSTQAMDAKSDAERLNSLVGDMRALVPVRRELEGLYADIAGGRFQRQVSDMRELATRDYLHRLTTVNDSRVLLNVYTALLLGVLGYLGFRLQRSYQELNQSHGDLGERVAARTKDLEIAYDDLKESQVQLVQAEKMSSLGQLVAGIVHEINTPLLYVVNNATIITENIEELRSAVEKATQVAGLLKTRASTDPEVADAITALTDSVDVSAVDESMDEIASLAQDSSDGLNQISELVNSLKDFSRLDRAAEDYFDVRDGLEKTLLITKNMLKYGIEVNKEFSDVPKILCSPSRINQVFINLITNAVQAMDGQGFLGIRAWSDDQWVKVCISDTGSGIEDEHLEKITDPFFTTKPVGQGTGLGLSIVSKIIEEHGGRLEIDSSVGEGTDVTICLPLGVRSDPIATAEAA
jgi:signal transduction histidine kinase